MTKLTLTINGGPVSDDVEPRLLLVEFIREVRGLTGTHIGCDTSQCGACVVHLDGDPVKSCTLFAVQAEGTEITTIEGVSPNGGLNPMQRAFREHHGLQCGFCTPGMVMTAMALVRDTPSPTESEIRHGLEGNICRCTGYQNIVKAIDAGAKAMQGAGTIQGD